MQENYISKSTHAWASTTSLRPLLSRSRSLTSLRHPTRPIDVFGHLRSETPPDIVESLLLAQNCKEARIPDISYRLPYCPPKQPVSCVVARVRVAFPDASRPLEALVEASRRLGVAMQNNSHRPLIDALNDRLDSTGFSHLVSAGLRDRAVLKLLSLLLTTFEQAYRWPLDYSISTPTRLRRRKLIVQVFVHPELTALLPPTAPLSDSMRPGPVPQGDVNLVIQAAMAVADDIITEAAMCKRPTIQPITRPSYSATFCTAPVIRITWYKGTMRTRIAIWSLGVSTR